MSAAPVKSEWNSESIKDIIKSFPLLEGFSSEMLNELVQAAEVIELPVHTQILQQGQTNQHLYFLVNGQVGVFVDGGRVSKLQRKGDLLGEMSVISQKTVGATILTESPATLVRINSRFFLDMQGPDRDRYLSLLFRIYATVLAEKLHETNQKAKSFEELTFKLTATQSDLEEANQGLERKVEERTARLEQQNAVLQASVYKMEELINNKRLLFQKLSEFQNQSLAPLKSFLDDVRKRFPEENSVNEARRLVFDVQQILIPMTDQYSNEMAVHGKRVLLADSQRKQLAIAKMALGGTGVLLDLASSAEEGREKLKAEKYDLVMFDTSMVEIGKIAREKDPKIDLVLMTSDQLPTYLPAMQELSLIPHIVSRNEADRTFTVKNIMTTVTKLLSRDFFGLGKYMGWGVDIQRRPVVSSRQRPDLLSALDLHFENLGVRRANRDRIRIVAEEMLMNAIYDAPTDEHGKSLFNHLPRTTDLTLKADQQSLLQFATDGMIIGVSVQDPFGSLKGSTILHYLEKNYSGSAHLAHGQENKGGGGRGLHQIVECSDLVVFNIEPGKKTEVIALFNVEVKEKQNLSPSFHLFVKD